MAAAHLVQAESDTFVTATNPLVGRPLADWGDLRFLDEPSRRSPRDFRGRVVVVRFWTLGCPRCQASATTLAQWARRYGNQGFEVIAILLPKGNAVVSDDSLRLAAKNMGWNATLAVDQDWSALKRVWDHGGPRYSVSVGLLVDRQGMVRAVHHGGYLSESDPRGQAETRSFRTALEQVLAEHDPITDSSSADSSAR
jgi:thiol-disulfide isomerase/thioredoxin